MVEMNLIEVRSDELFTQFMRLAHFETLAMPPGQGFRLDYHLGILPLKEPRPEYEAETGRVRQSSWLRLSFFALRPNGKATSRPRRQGSGDERSGKNGRTALDSAPIAAKSVPGSSHL